MGDGRLGHHPPFAARRRPAAGAGGAAAAVNGWEHASKYGGLHDWVAGWPIQSQSASAPAK